MFWRVPSAVTEIDPPEERNLLVDDNAFLMMRPEVDAIRMPHHFDVRGVEFQQSLKVEDSL